MSYQKDQDMKDRKNSRSQHPPPNKNEGTSPEKGSILKGHFIFQPSIPGSSKRPRFDP